MGKTYTLAAKEKSRRSGSENSRDFSGARVMDERSSTTSFDTPLALDDNDDDASDAEDKPVSATEVNRFCYCAWQWYYERVYGQAYIRQLRKERNEALGYTDAGQGAFTRGRAFHDNFMQKYTARQKWRWLVTAILLAAVFILWMWWRYA